MVKKELSCASGTGELGDQRLWREIYREISEKGFSRKEKKVKWKIQKIGWRVGQRRALQRGVSRGGSHPEKEKRG